MRIRSRSLSSLALGAALAVTLVTTGCGAPVDPTRPTPSPTPTTTEPTEPTTEPTGPTTEPTEPTTEPTEPTTEPTEPADPTQPAYSALVATPGSLAEVVIGQPVDTEPRDAAMARWDADYCADVQPSGDPGRWVVRYPAATAVWGGSTEPFSIAASKTGAVTWVAIYATDLSTDRGIHPGSTWREFRDAYPEAKRTATDDRLWAVSAGGGILLFEILPSGAVTQDSPRQVAVVHLVDRLDRLPTSTYGSDHIPNGCL